jgi:hypothetical protein
VSDEDWLEGPPARLPVHVDALPADYQARMRLLDDAWARLSTPQKTFLQAWRECNFNASATNRLLGFSENNKPNKRWMQEYDYELVVRIWRANAAASALDKDRLLARQDGIVKALLTPKPVLHQGLPVFDPARPGEILQEIEAAAASRANEVLLDRAMPKPRTDTEVNVGVVVGIPTLTIQVMPLPPSKVAAAQSVVIDAKFTENPGDEWLDA